MLPFGCSGHFPPLQWTRQTFAVVGIFPFVPMGMSGFDGSGPFSLHLQWACWTFAVLGIFSFHSNRHVAFWLFWASFPFIQTGVLRFGCSGHLFLHEVGHVAFGHFGAFFLSCKWACRILVVLAMLSFH